MTRLEALEAVAAAARAMNVGCTDWDWETSVTGFRRAVDCGRCHGCRLTDALAALDQTAPQPPGVDPQPRRGEPDPMIPDLLAQAYGSDR